MVEVQVFREFLVCLDLGDGLDIRSPVVVIFTIIVQYLGSLARRGLQMGTRLLTSLHFTSRPFISRHGTVRVQVRARVSL